MQWFMKATEFDSRRSRDGYVASVRGMIQGEHIRAYATGEEARVLQDSILAATPAGMSPTSAGHVVSVTGILRRSNEGQKYIQATVITLLQGATLELFHLREAAEVIISSTNRDNIDPFIAQLLNRIAPPLASLNYEDGLTPLSPSISTPDEAVVSPTIMPMPISPPANTVDDSAYIADTQGNYILDVEAEVVPEVVEALPEVATEVVVESLPEVVPEAVVEALPEVVPEAVAEALPEVVPEAVVEALPEVVPEAVVEALPEVVPEAVVEALPEVVPEAVVEALPEVVPEAVVEALPEVAPEVVAEALPEVVPEAVVEALPEVVPEAVVEALPEVAPEVVAEVLPEVVPEVVPEAVVEALPEVAPEVVAEVLPEVVPEAVVEAIVEAAVTVVNSAPEVILKTTPKVVFDEDLDLDIITPNVQNGDESGLGDVDMYAMEQEQISESIKSASTVEEITPEAVKESTPDATVNVVTKDLPESVSEGVTGLLEVLQPVNPVPARLVVPAVPDDDAEVISRFGVRPNAWRGSNSPIEEFAVTPIRSVEPATIVKDFVETKEPTPILEALGKTIPAVAQLDMPPFMRKRLSR